MEEVIDVRSLLFTGKIKILSLALQYETPE
jgi:hypothetical protein